LGGGGSYIDFALTFDENATHTNSNQNSSNYQERLKFNTKRHAADLFMFRFSTGARDAK
jgi:hypothetical protein